MFKTIVAVGLLLVASEAIAQTLPKYEIFEFARHLMHSPHGGSQSRYNAVLVDRVKNSLADCSVVISGPQGTLNGRPSCRSKVWAQPPSPLSNVRVAQPMVIPDPTVPLWQVLWMVNQDTGAVTFCTMSISRIGCIPVERTD
jgi:hypothetical protein